MTATRKLFLAVLLVSVGVCVAALLGEPASRWYARPAADVPAASQHADGASRPIIGVSMVSQNGGARLVPDFAAASSDGAHIGVLSADVALPLLPGPGADDDAASSADSALAARRSASGSVTFGARARLRDEAPRPLEIERRASDSIESAPLIGAPSAARTVSYDAAVNDPVGSAATIAPPLWPPRDDLECDSPRTHIIVDGDSLEKLAERYLDDSRRGNEIYEANRELLSSPDLLPIGVELNIPPRASVPTTNSASPQSYLPRTVAIHTSAASHRGMVPVRPIPSGAGLMPRAQLARPLPVE